MKLKSCPEGYLTIRMGIMAGEEINKTDVNSEIFNSIF